MDSESKEVFELIPFPIRAPEHTVRCMVSQLLKAIPADIDRQKKDAPIRGRMQIAIEYLELLSAADSSPDKSASVVLKYKDSSGGDAPHYAEQLCASYAQLCASYVLGIYGERYEPSKPGMPVPRLSAAGLGAGSGQ